MILSQSRDLFDDVNMAESAPASSAPISTAPAAPDADNELESTSEGPATL
ncbi:hypothetical protein RMSM_04380 [Rhodopirellula maiorica SM1]|uniref:Uncharacterized protein n=1 Tax=Rhodopirellula maiorica SM1 TaxID=1265738 RepID=M5RHL0_9BACT|nr:hypothetical protein [Rhodopirellula maiorica]EMI18686.1 hypothetical protein RMSM_04380 [Rhodopirellula maiorica SM1]